MTDYLIPIAALIVSISSFILTGISLRKHNTNSYTETVESRLQRVEREVEDCERERTRLAEENLRLLHQLVRRDYNPSHVQEIIDDRFKR